MRLIDADALKEELELSKYIIPNDLNRLLNSEINRCIEAIDNAPTIDVVKAFNIIARGKSKDGMLLGIKTGHWIKHISNIECSNCGEKFYCEEDENCQDYEPCNDFQFNYCPNCGADMRGVNNG